MKRTSTKTLGLFIFLAIISISNAFSISITADKSLAIEVPKGKSITVDGKMNEDEWKDAFTQELKNGGNIKINHDGEFLQVGLNGGKAGLSHVYLTDGKEVFVLHASAALGMAVYRKEGVAWQPTQKFKWELRDQATNSEGSSAYLKTNGWLASVSNMSATDREYRVSMKFKEADKFRLVAVYYNNPTSPQFFPNTIADDTLKPQLLFGSEPTNLDFKFEQWATLKLKDSENSPKDSAINELLELHNQQRVAHFNRDAKLLISMFDENFAEIRNGKVSFVKKEDALKRFQAYFDASTFIEWDDITPPIIKVSDDATMAYLLVNKRVRLKTKDDKEETTVFAWTSTFQKIKGEWLMTSIASTVQPK